MNETLSEIIDHVTTNGSHWTITKDGKPVAVIVSYEEYGSLVETIDVLSDDGTMAAIEEAERDG